MKQAEILKQAQQIQKKLSEVMASTRAQAASGGGMVKALSDGNGVIIELTIEEEIIESQDKTMLEDLVLAAVNEARRKAQEAAREEAKKIIGIPLPGLF